MEICCSHFIFCQWTFCILPVSFYTNHFWQCRSLAFICKQNLSYAASSRQQTSSDIPFYRLHSTEWAGRFSSGDPHILTIQEDLKGSSQVPLSINLELGKNVACSYKQHSPSWEKAEFPANYSWKLCRWRIWIFHSIKFDVNLGISCYSLAQSSGLQSSGFGHVQFQPRSPVSNKNKSLPWKTSTQSRVKSLPVPGRTEERISV